MHSLLLCPFVSQPAAFNNFRSTCSCVSIRTAKGIHVLEIDGQRTVPSIVAFTEKDYLVGKAAKSQVICSYNVSIIQDFDMSCFYELFFKIYRAEHSVEEVDT